MAVDMCDAKLIDQKTAIMRVARPILALLLAGERKLLRGAGATSAP
jgi:hypothetical protein